MSDPNKKIPALNLSDNDTLLAAVCAYINIAHTELSQQIVFIWGDSFTYEILSRDALQSRLMDAARLVDQNRVITPADLFMKNTSMADIAQLVKNDIVVVILSPKGTAVLTGDSRKPLSVTVPQNRNILETMFALRFTPQEKDRCLIHVAYGDKEVVIRKPVPELSTQVDDMVNDIIVGCKALPDKSFLGALDPALEVAGCSLAIEIDSRTGAVLYYAPEVCAE